MHKSPGAQVRALLRVREAGFVTVFGTWLGMEVEKEW